MSFLQCLLLAVLTLAQVNATPILGHATRSEAVDRVTPIVHTASLTPNIVHEFPKGTWLENLVIREKDGNAVVTLLSEPEVWLVSTTDSFEPTLLARFDNNLGCLGIVEFAHDVYYIAVGNWSAKTAKPTPGSWSVWEIDLNDYLEHRPHVQTKLVAELPNAGFLNGMTVLNPVEGTVLVADSLYSAVWSVNVRTGETKVVINDTTMSILPDAASGLALGINAVHNPGDGYLYYDNTDRATFNRIPLDPVSGAATGPAEMLLENSFSNFIPDDFTIDFAGNGWLVSGRGEVALLRSVETDSDPIFEIIAGSQSDPNITGDTAAKFGRSRADLERGSLYVTTTGGAINYFTGNWTAGGMLVRYDTAQLGVY